jgi:hypothetical protein
LLGLTIVSPQVAVAFKHKHSSPQVAIAKMGLEKQPHFHKATWVQSTSVFPAFRSLYMDRFVELVGLPLSLCTGLLKAKENCRSSISIFPKPPKREETKKPNHKPNSRNKPA